MESTKIGNKSLSVISNKVVVNPTTKPKTTENGLIIPDTITDIPTTGVIMIKGKEADENIQMGDTVFFSKNNGIWIEIDGTRLLVLRDTDIVAIVREEVLVS